MSKIDIQKNSPKALYLHVPFCSSICAYCDFSRVNYNESITDKWLTQITNEVNEISSNKLDTLYIGGGTPTSLHYAQLEQLLILLSKFNVAKEYTIEINPETLDVKKAMLLSKYGVNRASIGVQSFNDELLKLMGRSHTADDISKCLQILNDLGITNISIDLMYGLPTQTLDMLKADLLYAVTLPIEHVSIYSLTIEPNSKFGRTNVQQIDNELETSMYELAISILTSYGFEQYEISSFAKNKSYSKHNKMYWHYEDFYGVGLGASGKIGNIRYTNKYDFTAYFDGENSKEIVELSKEDMMFEYIMMGLRVNEGICIELFEKLFEVDFIIHYQKAIDSNVSKGLIVIENGMLKTTTDGMLLLHDVLVDFMEE